MATVTITPAYQLPGRRLQGGLSFPSGEIEVVAAMPATEAASFADLKRYATNLVGNTPAFLTILLGITVSGTTAVVEASGSIMSFIKLAISPPPPSPSLPLPPSPPPKPLGVGEMSKVGEVKDYATFFNSNLDGCYAKMAAPRIAADIAAALGFSESLVHVTPIEEATGRPWDNTGERACPVATGRRLEARGLLGHGECTTARPRSCACSTGACFLQTRFVIVIRVPQADAAAAAASAAAIMTLLAATRAAMWSTAALTTLFPSLFLDAEYRSTIQLTGSSPTMEVPESGTYNATFYYSAPSPPPPASVVVMPPPSPSPQPPSPSPQPPSPSPAPSPPPPPAMCACDQLINGASVFNTCVKVQGKQRICNGLGLTNQGASLCAADHFLCPSSKLPTSHNSPDLFADSGSCEDKKSKKKCAKKLQKGKCSKKKIAKKCRETCDLCDQ
jgi:hypothetical protein